MSSKPSSGPSKTRSSTSRTRKAPSTRTKTARTGTDTGMEQPVDDSVQDAVAAPAPKSTTRRSSTASTTRKKSTTPAAKTATKAAASRKKADVTAEDDATAEKNTPATTRRRSVKSKTDTAAEPADSESAKTPVKRTRRKPAASAAATQAEGAEGTAEEGTDSAKPASTRKAATRSRTTATRKAASPKKATTSRSRKAVTATESAAAEDGEAEEKAAAKPAKATRTRHKKAEVEETDSTPAKTAPKTARKTAKADSTTAEAATEENAEAPVRPTRRRTTRKKAAPTEGTEAAQAVSTPAGEEMAEPPAKPARRRRKSTAKTTEEAAASSAEATSDASEDSPAEVETKQEDATPRFTDLALSAPILKAVEEMGYTHPTPIQAQAIPEILAGHDVLGVAQTGTGKTASFTLPLLEKLSKSRARARMPRSLILEPTRELALQVAENFEKYGAHLRLNHALLIGGGKMNEQRELLNRGVDVLIATPGRLLDMFERGGLLMTQTDLLVIDEADRMLDMGFIPDIERIVSLLPRRRQTLFFSATMAPEIRRLADDFLNHPKEITVARQSSVASTITEGLLVVEKRNKNRALSALLRQEDVQNAIVFCNRKRDVDMLQSYLTRQKFALGHLHGDLTQSLRFETLERFRAGELQILVCSDVAARGIDIGGLSHVFNYDLPFNAEDYVHRIGRTGRAGKEGKAYSLATPDEHKLLEAVETLTGKTIEPIEIKGFRSLAWRSADEDGTEPPAKGKGKGRTRNGKTPVRADAGDEVEEPKKEESARQERAPRKKQAERNPMPEARKHDHRRGRAELLPPVPEKNGLQDGFGDNVPAFMKVSFVPEPRDPSDA